MSGILLNDLYVNKKMIWLRSGIVFCLGVLFLIPIKEEILEDNLLLFSILYPLVGILSLVFALICANQTIHEAISEDEKTDWQNFLLSVPSGVRGLVWMKYVETFVIYIGICLLHVVLFQVVEWMTGISIPKTIILLCGCFFFLQSALELPLMFRLGSRYGNYIKMGMGFALVFGVILYLLYGPIDGGVNVNSVLTHLIAWVNRDEAGIRWFENVKNTASYAVPLIILIIYFLSGCLSCKVFHSEKIIDKQ